MKIFGFKSMILAVMSILFVSQVSLSAQEQDDKIPTPEEMAAKEADRLASLLKLDPGQVFYVDSTLQHDYAAWQAEVEKLQKSRVSNYDIYNDVRDKWMEQIYNSLSRVFDEQQWTKYLKQGAGKDKKARDKRAAKRSSK